MFRDQACQFPQMHEALTEANAAWLVSGDIPNHEGAASGSGEKGQQLSDFIYPRPAFTDEARARHEDALRNTAVAQPAIGAVSLGALRILEHFGIQPEAVAGHSYGG